MKSNSNNAYVHIKIYNNAWFANKLILCWFWVIKVTLVDLKLWKEKEEGRGRGTGGGERGCNKIIILLIVDCILNFKFTYIHFSFKRLNQLSSQWLILILTIYLYFSSSSKTWSSFFLFAKRTSFYKSFIWYLPILVANISTNFSRSLMGCPLSIFLHWTQ